MKQRAGPDQTIVTGTLLSGQYYARGSDPLAHHLVHYSLVRRGM